MRKQFRTFKFRVSLTLLLTAVIGIWQMLPTIAHPYQIKGMEEYQQEQANWRTMIKRNPKNPEPYLQLGASLSSEASEGYWCNTAAMDVYREAIAAVSPNAQIHFQLGVSLVSEPDMRCEEPAPATRKENDKEGLFHLRKAIAIASENASLEELYQAADSLKIRKPNAEYGDQPK